MGTKHRVPPEGFAVATKLLGSVRRLAAFCGENDPKHVAHGIMPTETPELRDMVASIDVWLDQLVTSLKVGAQRHDARGSFEANETQDTTG